MLSVNVNVSSFPILRDALWTPGSDVCGDALALSFSRLHCRHFSSSLFSSTDYRHGRFPQISGCVLCLSYWVRSLVRSSGSPRVASMSSPGNASAIGSEELCVGKSQLIRSLAGNSSEWPLQDEVGFTCLSMVDATRFLFFHLWPMRQRT